MRRIARPLFGSLIVVTFLLAGAFAALATDEPTKPEPNDPKLVERGKIVYAEQCARCHGANLEDRRIGGIDCPMAECPPRRTTRPGTPGTIRTSNCST
jgi:hypothetical protein